MMPENTYQHIRYGAGGMGQQPKVLAALAEDPAVTPAPGDWLTYSGLKGYHAQEHMKTHIQSYNLKNILQTTGTFSGVFAPIM